MSARNFQLPDTIGGHCYAKSFDGYAPIGHAILTTRVMTDPQERLTYSTYVNGGKRQEIAASDMI